MTLHHYTNSSLLQIVEIRHMTKSLKIYIRQRQIYNWICRYFPYFHYHSWIFAPSFLSLFTLTSSFDYSFSFSNVRIHSLPRAFPTSTPPPSVITLHRKYLLFPIAEGYLFLIYLVFINSSVYIPLYNAQNVFTVAQNSFTYFSSSLPFHLRPFLLLLPYFFSSLQPSFFLFASPSYSLSIIIAALYSFSLILGNFTTAH